MFYLKQINLLNFKNYGNLQVNLHNGINVFTGANGIGKTNLIDAVHYLCMCKSFLSGNDSFNIKKGETVAMVQGNFVQDLNEFDVICNLRKEQKKVFKLNGKEYDKLADHVGRFPIVVVAPQDQALIQEGSDIRRRFVDSILSQTDRQYLKNLIKYNKALLQRNALLKTGQTLNELYEFFDFQLIETGQLILKKENNFLKHSNPCF
jgi:DNA replication and repair protein RecF